MKFVTKTFTEVKTIFTFTEEDIILLIAQEIHRETGQLVTATDFDFDVSGDGMFREVRVTTVTTEGSK